MTDKRRVLKAVGALLAVATGLAVVAAAYVYVASERVLHRRYTVPLEAVTLPTDAASIAEGGRLSTLYGCNGACHGEGIEGEVHIDEAGWGRLVAPNLSAFAHAYTPAEVARAVRRGVRPNGEGVFEMPSPSFYDLSDADLARIIAFLRAAPRVEGHPYEFRPGLHLRWLMASGDYDPLSETITEYGSRMPAPDPADTLQVGAYLARTVCAACHGRELDGDGADIPGLAVVAAYSRADFERLLRTGMALGGREVGMMSEEARTRFSHLTPTEVHALYAYLHARAAERAPAPPGAHPTPHAGWPAPMTLNHLNLSVTDVAAAADFLATHFGLERRGGNAGMALLVDDAGLTLTLMKTGKPDGARYPSTFHVGFFVGSEERVDALHRQLVEAGHDANAPERRHAYGFYVNAPGGFTIEVAA